MTRYDEETLAELVAALPPAPAAWVAAAVQLPRLRASLDEIVARAEQDAAFRAALLANLEQALRDAGYEPEGRLADAVRERLAGR